MLKGGTSYSIRKRYPFLKKYKSFWSPSYFCETIGNMSEKVIRKYIQNQKVNLKASYKYSKMVINLKMPDRQTSKTYLEEGTHILYGTDVKKNNKMSVKHTYIDECIRQTIVEKNVKMYQKHL